MAMDWIIVLIHLNSVTNIKGTSYRMGNGGTFTGDAAPGSRTTVQKKHAIKPTGTGVLSVMCFLFSFLNFTGVQQNNTCFTELDNYCRKRS